MINILPSNIDTKYTPNTKKLSVLLARLVVKLQLVEFFKLVNFFVKVFISSLLKFFKLFKKRFGNIF